jgi:hypothetical protein
VVSGCGPNKPPLRSAAEDGSVCGRRMTAPGTTVWPSTAAATRNEKTTARGYTGKSLDREGTCPSKLCGGMPSR